MRTQINTTEHKSIFGHEPKELFSMNRKSTNPHNTVTRTVRLESDVDQRLESIAEKEGVSVNFVVGTALRGYVEWDYPASKYGVMPYFSSSFRRMLSYLSDEDAKDYGKWEGKTVFKEYVLFWFKAFNLENTIKAIRLLGNSGRFEFEEHLISDTHTIICEHNLGAKCSLYYSEIFKCLFHELGARDVKIETGENQVLIELATPSRDSLES